MARSRIPVSIPELLVVTALKAEPMSVKDLARYNGMSVRTLQNRCKEEQTTAKDCLDFVRCLRAVLGTDAAYEPQTLLGQSSADQRTIRRLMSDGGLTRSTRPSLDLFLESQTFIRRETFRSALYDALKSARIEKDAELPSSGPPQGD